MANFGQGTGPPRKEGSTMIRVRVTDPAVLAWLEQRCQEERRSLKATVNLILEEAMRVAGGGK